MPIDINHLKYNSRAVYQKKEVTGLEAWTPARSGKHNGKDYSVYQRTFRHERNWKKGALVVVASVFTLGMAYWCSGKLQMLWQQAKAGNKVREIKVLDETAPISKIRNAIIEKGVEENYAGFIYSPEFRRDFDGYLEPEFIASYKKAIENRENSAAGYPVGYSSLLIALYFILDPGQKNQKARSYISYSGSSPEDNPASNRIAFRESFPLYNADKPYFDQFLPFLRSEIKKHPTGMRPKKIFIPIVFNNPSKIGHLVLLVIEPDPGDEKKANVTFINTWGTVSPYQFEEKLVEDAVRKAYPGCTYVSNKDRLWSGPFCGIDVVENARLLADVDNVQEFVAAGKLPKRDKKAIDQCTLDHAKQMELFLKSLDKWE